MAAPKHNKSNPNSPAFEKTRSKIQTTQLVKRLENYALSKKDDQGNDVVLDSTRISAIKILLDKSLPNLQSTELSGPEGKAIKTESTVIFNPVGNKD